MSKEIIAYIKNASYSSMPLLCYSDKYTDENDFLKDKKIYLHRFIGKPVKASSIYYWNLMTIYNENTAKLYQYIPFININRYAVFFDYNYYIRVYNTNSESGIINKRYLIDYDLIGVCDSTKSYEEAKDMKLKLFYIFDI